MTIDEEIRSLKKEFRLAMNGAVSQSMREKGLTYKINFGIEYPRLKEIVSHHEKSHELAQALWKEGIRESKIAATLLQPVESFYPEIADIWIDAMPNMEIAEFACMNLFQHLPYAPSKSFQWISEEREYAQICGFLTIARLLMKKGDMTERAENEFLDQALTCFISGSNQVQHAVVVALRRYMQHSEEHAFKACRMVDQFKDSDEEAKKLLYAAVKEEATGY